MAYLRLSVLFLLFAGQFLPVSAQKIDPDPTHWISYRQPYYKIPVAERGMYRITSSELNQAGVPIEQIDPVTIQLFHRGIEQAIFIEGEADHHFDAGDYLEFYGQPNDGEPDSLLYRPISAQPHRYYSLFNDTTAYFLTWQTNGKPGKRMAVQTDTTHAGLIPETYHWLEELRLFTSDYPGWAAGLPGQTEYSYYEAGEGYTGPMQQKNKPYSTSFQLTTPARTGPRPQLEILVVGRDITNHRVDGLAGSATAQHLQDSIRFTGYANAHLLFAVGWSAIDSNGQLMVSTVSGNESTSSDAYSVSYIRLRYPQLLTANRQPSKLFHLQPNPVGRSLLHITNLLPATDFWDITDPDTPIRLCVRSDSVTSALLTISGTTTSRTVLGSSERKRIIGLHRVTFTDWSARKPSFLIISHESLMKPPTRTTADSTLHVIQAYAAYRASEAGGGFDTLTTTMQQLIDQYSYGERHPLAIRRFIRQFLQSTRTIPFLLLIGRGRSTPGIRHDPQQAQLDMVMTAGYPGSDTWFSAGLLTNEPDVPAIPTGRINAATPDEVLNYLAKVKEYEKPSSDKLWRKNLLHLSGGLSPNEQSLFRQLVDSYQTQAIAPSLGAHVATFSKSTDQPVEVPGIAKTVNEGVGLITFFGHSGLDVTDLDIGFCSNEALGYRNKGKYPLLLVNGCAIGNFFYGRPTLATDWVLTPNRGAIAAIAHSHLGTTDLLNPYSAIWYNLLTDSSQLSKPIGLLQQETIRRMLAQSVDARALATCQQMILQGDPAIRLFPFTTPDYTLRASSLAIQATDNQPLTLGSDSVQIRIVAENAGQYQPGRLPIQVRRWANEQEVGVFNWELPHTFAYQDTLTLTIPNDRTTVGENQFEVIINPIGFPTSQRESDQTNNQASVALTIIPQKPVLIYPPLNATLTTTSLRLTAQYISDRQHRFELELDSSARFNSPFHKTQRLTATQFISYPTVLLNRPNTRYFWRVRLADNQTSLVDSTTWSVGSFVYNPGVLPSGLPEGQLQAESSFPTESRQGDTVRIPVQFINLSPYSFTDSLVVQQTVYATVLSAPQLTQWRIKSPTQADTVRFSVTIPTESIPGQNRVRLTVNPHLQPEYSFLNNTLDIPMAVQPDKLGPLLEVAFDGARIGDGSVVSAHPLIDVLVADDNRSLVRQDTTGMDLFLQKPVKNAPFERLSWQKVISQTIERDNIFRLRYPLPNLTDGVYHLLVTARDAVGNAAIPYQVSFRVVSEKSLGQFTVSPNPFRDHLIFSLQITGEEAPNTLLLTLNDLNGQRVRTLSPTARIGLNQLVWDGRDMAGNTLPAGIYVYQLSVLDAAGQAWPVSTGERLPLTGRVVLTR